MQALIVPERKLDVILSLDASADTDGNYPNGTAPFLTYTKTQLPGFDFTPFPFFPSPDRFVADGLAAKPTFFGCDGPGPLIVSLPNYAKVRNDTGTSTFQLQYLDDQVADFFANGLAIATQPDDPTWPSCLACALVDRQLQRNGTPRTTQCEGCFARFCYPSAAPTPDPPAPGPSQRSRRKREQRVLLQGEEALCPQGSTSCPTATSGYEVRSLACSS